MFVKIDPPGTFCNFEALRDALKIIGGDSFLEIGCGGGQISKFLCDRGMSGVGVDFSKAAITASGEKLADHIAAGRYRLVEGDAFDLPADFAKVDLGISYMVMEHVEDDTVGHLRRYERQDMIAVMNKAGLADVDVWSVGVPIGNITFGIGAWLVSRSDEVKKIGQSQREQTESSGLRDIPWKTVFPPWVRIILNRTTLWPLFVIQRLFYRSDLGITMMGMGRVHGPAA